MTSKHNPRVTPTVASAKATPVKPSVPYRSGACFKIKPHNPPPPFSGSSYKKPDPSEWNPDPWPDYFEDAPPTIVEQCLQHLPRRTTPLDQATRDLKVIGEIRCGDPCNAQVVRCNVDGKDLVAKIFDPLYISQGKCDELECSPVTLAETFYSYEAAAYIRIKEKGLDGKYTPCFEGCWCLELPIHDTNGRLVSREVRLILQQFIAGDTMQHLIEQKEVDKIDPEVRMDLLDRLMEALSQLAFIGVQSDDLHPRNYMVSEDKNEKNGWKITLIDFSHSRVSNLPTSKWWTPEGKDAGLPANPMSSSRLWPPRCQGWIPREYDCATRESFDKRLKRMKERWEGSKEYGPVIERRLPKYKDRG
jgi:hypothetical protein